jgi:hypothetical protein
MPRPAKSPDGPHQARLKAKMEMIYDKSVWPFLTAIVFNYNTLAAQRQQEMKRRYNKMQSCFTDEGGKRFVYNSDRLMKQALMAAMSRYYPDFEDKNLANFIEGYMRSKSAKLE